MTKKHLREWRCYDCDTRGWEVDRDMARAAFEAHWLRYHQNIPWLDDDASLDAL